MCSQNLVEFLFVQAGLIEQQLRFELVLGSLSGCDQKETLCGQKETGRRWVVEPLAKPEARAPLGPQGGRGPSGARREKIFTPAAKEFLNALLGGYP